MFSSPHTLSHRPHGLLRDKDMAGKPVQDWVFGNEAKVTAKQRQKDKRRAEQSSNSEQDFVLYIVFNHKVTAECFYQLFFGWHPQKEMFFIWKKWLHLSNWKKTDALKNTLKNNFCLSVSRFVNKQKVTSVIFLSVPSFLPFLSLSHLLREVILILQTHDQLHSLEANLQITQRWRTEMHCPLPRHGNLCTMQRHDSRSFSTDPILVITGIHHMLIFCLFVYLLHGSTEDAVALVVRHFNRTQKLHSETLHPCWVSLHC